MKAAIHHPMRLIIQRVTNAKVEVDGEVVSEIGRGLFILVGITHGDTEADAEYLYVHQWYLNNN